MFLSKYFLYQESEVQLKKLESDEVEEELCNEE